MLISFTLYFLFLYYKSTCLVLLITLCPLRSLFHFASLILWTIKIETKYEITCKLSEAYLDKVLSHLSVLLVTTGWALRRDCQDSSSLLSLPQPGPFFLLCCLLWPSASWRLFRLCLDTVHWASFASAIRFCSNFACLLVLYFLYLHRCRLFGKAQIDSAVFLFY